MQTPSGTSPERAVYRPPPDAFAWPQNASRGDDMVADARNAAQAAAAANSSQPGAHGAGDAGAGASPGPSAQPGGAQGSTGEADDRAQPSITIAVDEVDPHRGLPLRVHGMVRADGEACAHVAVEILLRDGRTHHAVALGTLATGDDGAFAGAIVVPGSTPLGDYDVVARTPGDARCGSGGSN
jgi:hypothetical protein